MKYIIRFSIFNYFIFFDQNNQICPKWIKIDQIWSNLISDAIIIEIYYQIFNFIYFLIRFNQICSEWIKMDQTWSIWISDETMYHQIFNYFYFLIRFNQIFPEWIKLDQFGFLMKISNFSKSSGNLCITKFLFLKLSIWNFGSR